MEVIFWALVFFVSCAAFIHEPISILLGDSKHKHILATIVGLCYIITMVVSGLQLVQILE